MSNNFLTNAAQRYDIVCFCFQSAPPLASEQCSDSNWRIFLLTYSSERLNQWLALLKPRDPSRPISSDCFPSLLGSGSSSRSCSLCVASVSLRHHCDPQWSDVCSVAVAINPASSWSPKARSRRGRECVFAGARNARGANSRSWRRRKRKRMTRLCVLAPAPCYVFRV